MYRNVERLNTAGEKNYLNESATNMNNCKWEICVVIIGMPDIHTERLWSKYQRRLF
jgi:hypothetical protein